jgi:hypothetical protein
MVKEFGPGQWVRNRVPTIIFNTLLHELSVLVAQEGFVQECFPGSFVREIDDTSQFSALKGRGMDLLT